MNYQKLREQLKDFVVFSLSDIRKVDPGFYRSRLNEWQTKNYIKKLRRGYYMFADLALNEDTLFLIANRLYVPSYISFETALSYYGLIPEGVYSMTSVSTKKTSVFKTPVARFSYRTISPSLFFGYRLEKHKGQGYKIAEMEKALLDYAYFNPGIVRESDFYEWRFNSEEFLLKADKIKLQQYTAAFKNKKLTQRINELLTLMQKDRGQK